ncbi:MAG: pyridoxamine 5'-phosphate oxidase family protein [Candidatus Eremiobacterota bacterium]
MLPPVVASLFEEIRKGSVFPFAWLATVDDGAARGGSPCARVRTVRVIGFNLQQGKFYVATHRRHAKIEQIQARPLGELCFTELTGPLQLRFGCRLSLLGEDKVAMRDSFWRKLPEESRWRFYACEPEVAVPPPDFAVLQADVHEVDLLDLRPERSLRRGFLRQGADWAEEERML